MQGFSPRLEDDISFLVSAYFQGWTVSQMRLSKTCLGMSGIFFKLVTRWVAASFGETTQAEVKTLVKTVVKWLSLLRPVLGDEFSRKPTYLLPAGTNLSPSSSLWDMDSGAPRGYRIPQPGMNFTTNKLQVQWMIGWRFPLSPITFDFWKLEGHHIGGGKDLGVPSS